MMSPSLDLTPIRLSLQLRVESNAAWLESSMTLFELRHRQFPDETLALPTPCIGNRLRPEFTTCEEGLRETSLRLYLRSTFIALTYTFSGSK